MAFLVAQMVKHLPAVQETQVQSLSWEDPLEKEMATHSSTLAWKIPWTEKPGGLQSMGLQRVGHDWVTSLRSGPAFRLGCCHMWGPSQLGMSRWQKVPSSPSSRLAYHFWASRTLFFFFFHSLKTRFWENRPQGQESDPSQSSVFPSRGPDGKQSAGQEAQHLLHLSVCLVGCAPFHLPLFIIRVMSLKDCSTLFACRCCSWEVVTSFRPAVFSPVWPWVHQ